MATPEENTLLALRLFQPVGDNIAAGNNQRTGLLAKIAEIQNEHAFQREQTATTAGNQLNYLSRLQQGQSQLEDKRTAEQTSLEATRVQNDKDLAAETFKRQMAVSKQARDAQSQEDLNKQFALTYPVYAHSAAALGEKIKPQTAYVNSWAGLGDLQADMEDLKTQADKKNQTAAAQGVISILDDATKQLKDAIDARDKVNQLNDQDRSQIQQAGLDALSHAVNNGTIPGLDADSEKFKTGFAALNKASPDLDVAQQAMGSAAVQTFQSGVKQGMQALVNDKDRLGRFAAASRDVVAAQRGASQTLTHLLGVAATNPQLGPMLAQRNQQLNSLDATASGSPGSGPDSITPPNTDTIFQQLTNPTAPAGATPPPPGATPGPLGAAPPPPAAAPLPPSMSGAPVPALGAFQPPAPTPAAAMIQRSPTGGLIRSAGDVEAGRTLQHIKNWLGSFVPTQASRPVMNGQVGNNFLGQGNSTPTEVYWNQVRQMAADPGAPDRLQALQTGITLARARGETVPQDIASEFGINGGTAATPPIGQGTQTTLGSLQSSQPTMNENDQLAQILAGAGIGGPAVPGATLNGSP